MQLDFSIGIVNINSYIQPNDERVVQIHRTYGKRSHLPTGLDKIDLKIEKKTFSLSNFKF